MTTPALDEFNDLFAEQKGGKQHPEDEAESSSATSRHSKDDPSPRRNVREKKSSPDSEDDPSSSKMRTRYFLPRHSHHSDANTGPKGVIADAFAFETAKKAAHRLSFLPSRQSKFQPSAPPPQYRRDPEKSEGSDEDEHEDAFMQRWRTSRLRELQSQAVPGVGARKASPSGRRWGAVPAVDAEGYLDAVEKSPKGTVVVVLIYDDESEVSDHVESCVRQLAKVYPSTRFIRLHYKEAEMENMGVPAILAYRNGDKFAGLVPVVDEIPEEIELNADSLEMAMRKHQILS